jgi:hypothetical protein
METRQNAGQNRDIKIANKSFEIVKCVKISRSNRFFKGTPLSNVWKREGQLARATAESSQRIASFSIFFLRNPLKLLFTEPAANIQKIMSEHHVGPETHLKMYRSLETVSILHGSRYS